MPYCLPADLRSRAAILAQVDDAPLAESIATAEDIVNGRLAGLYPVPYGTAPGYIKQITADLATSYALVSPHALGAQDAPVELARYFREQADKELDRLAPKGGSVSSDTPADLPLPGFASSYDPSDCTTKPVLKNFDLVNLPPTHGVPIAPQQRTNWGSFFR